MGLKSKGNYGETVEQSYGTYEHSDSERAERFAALKAQEQQRARFKAEEEAKIQAERRVQEKNMDQTEALIAAIRAQVEKEKAAKEAANKKEGEKVSSAKNSSSTNAKQYRTISPDEMEKIEERKRMKASGFQLNEQQSGVTGNLGGLGGGPTLSNPTAGGPTLSNPNEGQPGLGSLGLSGGGLGIDITAGADNKDSVFNADENTVALDVNGINEAAGRNGTIIVDDGNSGWSPGGLDEGNSEELRWVESDIKPQHVKEHEVKKNSMLDGNGDILSVVPVKQKPLGQNDVQSAYNIDFDDEEDDDFISFGMSSARSGAQEEEARRKAEEEVRRRAEEEARRKAEEEVRRRAEEEVRRRAEEEARRKAEEEVRRRAEEEARRKAAEEEEARRKAEEEVRRRAEEEARRRAEEEEARRREEEEAKRRAEEEARRRAEEEARRREEEEAKRRAEEEARRRAEEETKRRAEEEARIREEEEIRKKAEEEAEKYIKLAEEARRKAEEAKKALEEAKNSTASKETFSAAPQRGAYSLPVGAEQYLGKYLSVSSISDQIVQAMKYISDNPSEPRNIVILGQYGFGTTAIAEDFARSFHAMGICKTKTIAKIKAAALNRANISDAISKLQGGCLVVENAGIITNDKLGELYEIVSNSDNDVVVIMTGQIDTLSRIFKDNVVISKQFKHLIQVNRITDLDVFEIAKNHAASSGYPCDSGAEGGLRRRMQEVESGNLDRVLKIVDNAVSKAHNREMGTGEQDHHLVSGDFE